MQAIVSSPFSVQVAGLVIIETYSQTCSPIELVDESAQAEANAQVVSIKAATKIANNKMISKNISTPVIKFVKESMTGAKKALQSSPLFGEQNKGFKAYFVNTAVKSLDAIEKYGKRGSEKLVKNIDLEIKELKELQKGAKGTELAEIKENIAALAERKRNAATENLITKVTTNTVGAGAGTVAVVEANRDRDNNGIADIGEHDA